MENKYQEEEETLLEKIDDIVFEILPPIVYRWMHDIPYYPKYVKRFFQRIIRGYDDSYTWNLGDSLGKDIVKHLKDFRGKKDGYPARLDSYEEWEEILDKMIEGFEYLVSDEDYNVDYSDKKAVKKYTEDYKEAQDKAKLLIDHYGSLWW